MGTGSVHTVRFGLIHSCRFRGSVPMQSNRPIPREVPETEVSAEAKGSAGLAPAPDPQPSNWADMMQSDLLLKPSPLKTKSPKEKFTLPLPLPVVPARFLKRGPEGRHASKNPEKQLVLQLPPRKHQQAKPLIVS